MNKNPSSPAGAGIRVALCLALLPFAATLARADDTIRVDVVVNTTDAGDKLPKTTPEHPTYFFPWTAGYIETGLILHAQTPPPPTWEIQHELAKALAKRGYLMTNKGHPPSIVLILWWGYLAPVIDHPQGDFTGGGPQNESPGSASMVGIGISNGHEFTQIGDLPKTTLQGEGAIGLHDSGGWIPTAAEVMGGSSYMPAYTVTEAPNDHQMFLLVAGDKFEEDLGRVSRDTNELHESAHHPRYFLMVSALDFQAATQRKPVLLWCARVSTEMAGRNLGDVIGALIETGVPRFGEDTGGPKFLTSGAVPMGRVEVGTPVLKATYPGR